jgi:hypothetical protein
MLRRTAGQRQRQMPLLRGSRRTEGDRGGWGRPMSTCHSDENTAAAMGPAKRPTQAKKVWDNPTLSYLSVGHIKAACQWADNTPLAG